jgi:uncharacterized protein (TIGR00297 family)
MYFTTLPLVEALIAAVAFGAAAYALGTVSKSGFSGGVLLGAAIYYCAGWRGFAVLGLFFVIGSSLTVLGYKRKAAKGIAQADKGRRGAAHALANCAAGVVLALIYKISSGDPLIGALFAASFATAAADTAGTEIGSLYGGTTMLPVSFRRVPPGTPGAVSLQGTLAGAAVALIIAFFARLVGLVPTGALALTVAGAAFLSAWLESVLGALPGMNKILGNKGKNILNTATGALLCLILAKSLGLT